MVSFCHVNKVILNMLFKEMIIFALTVAVEPCLKQGFHKGFHQEDNWVLTELCFNQRKHS